MDAPTFLRNAEGVVLPDVARTPGASFEDVKAEDLCALHYTLGVRKPRFNAKVEAFARYGVSIRDRDMFQVDHLIPVSLGGNNNLENLWPQPYDERVGAELKDQLERKLRGLVCSNLISLEAAQQAIAQNWWAAYGAYMAIPTDPGSEGPEVAESNRPQPGEVVNGGQCALVGEAGLTEPRRIALTCAANDFGELKWVKRS